MQELAESCVAAWTAKERERYVPSLIDWYCPGCGRLVSYSITNQWTDLPNNCLHNHVRCPGCRLIVHFLVFNMGQGANSLAGGKLFMFPASRTHSPILEVLANTELSAPLKNAYKSAINVSNAKEWNASAVLCRRLIEGIAKAILPAELHDKPLAKQLEELPNHRNLSEPLLQLAHTVRKGGNLGAHFELEREPNEQVATLMLELCEDLLEYLFVLPVRINELHARIEKLGAPTNAPN